MEHVKIINLIESFYKKIEKEDLHIESLVISDSKGMFYSHHFIDKGPRNIYSHSKSFLSLMFGIAMDEGLVSLDDHVVDYFKEEFTKEQYDEFYPMLIRHPLTMTSGFDEQYLMMGTRNDIPDFLQFIFSHHLKKKPGENFVYSNGDSYIVARILEKIYKKSLLEICNERIFSKLDIINPVWEADKQGHSFGASGLELTIEDMNKLGILVLNKGCYKGQRIVSEEYIDLLYKTNIDIHGAGWGSYSLQFWQTPEINGIRADGAYGQFTFIYPKADLAISIQRNEDDQVHRICEILREEVFKKI